MKKVIVIVLLLIGSLHIHAQTDMRDGIHIFNYDIQLTTCASDGTALAAPSTETIEAETKFRVIAFSGTDYIITVLKFTSGSTKAGTLNQSLVMDNSGNRIYFKLSQTDYKLNAERLGKKGSFTVGAATTLIKVRPGRKEPKDGYNIYSEFGNDFNIGVSAGWKIEPNRKKPISHSIVGGLSFSSIKVTPYTTKDYISAESTQGCITFSAGYVFEYNKFQVSIFSGLDVMSGEVGRKWIYRNRPWLGLGFGFQIFRAEGKTEN